MSAMNNQGASSQSSGASGAGDSGTGEEFQQGQQAGSEGQGQEQGNEGQQGQQGQEGQQGSAQSGEGTQQQSGLSAEAIAAIVKSTIEGVTPRQQQQEQPLDREALKKQLNVFEPDENLLAGVLKGGQEGLNALLQIVDGISKQAITIANYQAQQMMAEFGQRLGPVEGYFKEQQMNALKAEFIKANPDLNGYEVICEAVKDQLVASGFRGTKEQVFKAVADGARKVIKGLPSGQGGSGGGSGQGGNGATPSGQQQQRKMSTLMQGGRGSGASGSAGGKKAPAGMEVFR